MYITNIIFEKENTVKVVSKLFSLLKIKVSEIGLKESLIKHPNFPSLLSISDVLFSFGIENISLITTIDDLPDFQMPCIIPIESEVGENFIVLNKIKGETLYYYSPVNIRSQKIIKSDFMKVWKSGIVMILNAENPIGEHEYERRSNYLKEQARIISYILLPLLILTVCISAYNDFGLNALLPILFTIFSLIGAIITAMLLWLKVDKNNHVIQRICNTSTKSTSCNAVINSEASKILGISLSQIGFVYFVGILIYILFTGVYNQNTIYILAWLNLPALPFVLFSIYYQWKVIKKWCPLCLAIQIILMLQGVITFLGDWHFSTTFYSIIGNTSFIPILLSFVFPAIGSEILLISIKETNIKRKYQQELMEIKYDIQIFNFKLKNQKRIIEDKVDLGISYGNLESKNKIIKVCNPYCSPCSKSHVLIKKLLSANVDIQVQIIFSTSGVQDPRAQPVKHFLALREKFGQEVVNSAIEDWYLSENKNYSQYANKYPVDIELNTQNSKIEEMQKWCNDNDITYTPTIYFNGYRLPGMYNVDDLRYLIDK